MMDHIFNELLALTRAGLMDVPLETDISPEDWYAIIKIAEEQNLISILYRAVRISGLKVPDEILTRIKAGFFQDIRLDRLQNSELEQLFLAFEDQGVDYFPIKGAVMKKYYPGSVYRWMSDADIFIREDQYGIISGIMKNAGYSFLDESEHEFRWKKSGFLIEFHKQAMSYYYADVVDYFGDGFSRAHRIGNSHRYQFDATDELIFVAVHFVKHYFTGAAKIRNITDLYYLWVRGGENEKKLEEVLESMNLLSFYRILKKNVMAWLRGVSLDESGELIFRTVLTGSNEEKRLRKYINWEVRSNRGKTRTTSSAKVRTVLKRLFIPGKKIRTRFRIFREHPLLLPIYWIWRGFYLIIFRKERLKEYVIVQFKDSEEYLKKYVEYMKEMRTLGLEQAVVGGKSGSFRKQKRQSSFKQNVSGQNNGRRERVRYGSDLLTPRECVLVKALSGDLSFADSAHLLTDNMDADRESSLYLLSLGIVGFRQGWTYFPSGIIPRIRGIHRYYQVADSAAAPWLREKLAVLEQAGIPFVLTGGTAMRAHYASDTPRMMNGYDITVRSKDHEAASSLLRSAVQTADPKNPFERTISGRTILRLHKGVPDGRLFSERAFWANAESSVYLDHKVLIPSSEDMLLHLLCTPFAPYICDEDHTDRARRLAESCIVIRSGISYEVLAKTAERAGLTDVVRFYLVLLTDLVPNIIDRKDWEPFFPDRFSYRLFVRELDWLARIRPGKKPRDPFLRFVRRVVRKHIVFRRIRK